MSVVGVSVESIARRHGIHPGAEEVNQQPSADVIMTALATQWSRRDTDVPGRLDGLDLQDALDCTDEEITRLLGITMFSEEVLRQKLCVEGIIVPSRVDAFEHCLEHLIHIYGPNVIYCLGKNHLIETGAIIYKAPRPKRKKASKKR